MDGMADGADAVFLLTTNRPDLLEPVLAARPGRIDQALGNDLPGAGPPAVSSRVVAVELHDG